MASKLLCFWRRWRSELPNAIAFCDASVAPLDEGAIFPLVKGHKSIDAAKSAASPWSGRFCQDQPETSKEKKVFK